ncbi:MAG: hypothetical protein ACRCW9_03990 [Cetobacterium sp.]
MFGLDRETFKRRVDADFHVDSDTKEQQDEIERQENKDPDKETEYL